MQAQVDVLKDDIKSFTVADAQGKDDKQISDIDASFRAAIAIC